MKGFNIQKMTRMVMEKDLFRKKTAKVQAYMNRERA